MLFNFFATESVRIHHGGHKNTESHKGSLPRSQGKTMKHFLLLLRAFVSLWRLNRVSLYVAASVVLRIHPGCSHGRMRVKGNFSR
mgnify:CR=1 FL=1